MVWPSPLVRHAGSVGQARMEQAGHARRLRKLWLA
jgi:hypothetical protein